MKSFGVNRASRMGLERAMRFELTTSTLARWRSTTELRPRQTTREALFYMSPEYGQAKIRKFSMFIFFFVSFSFVTHVRQAC